MMQLDRKHQQLSVQRMVKEQQRVQLKVKQQ